MSEESLEAPEADAAEQQAAAVPEDADDNDLAPVTPPPPLEADSADAAEQARDLGPDTEDEYR